MERMRFSAEIRPWSLAAGFAVLALAACSTTHITSSWRGPAAGPVRFQKIAALALVANEASRREAEDEMVKQIRHGTAVPGYALFQARELEDHETVKAKLRDGGFDGALVLRLVRVEKEHSWSRDADPASYYSFSSYYRMAAPMAYDPGTLEETAVVRVETSIFSLAEDKLVWACLSDTTAVDGASALVRSLAIAVADELESEGLLAER